MIPRDRPLIGEVRKVGPHPNWNGRHAHENAVMVLVKSLGWVFVYQPKDKSLPENGSMVVVRWNQFIIRWEFLPHDTTQN